MLLRQRVLLALIFTSFLAFFLHAHIASSRDFLKGAFPKNETTDVYLLVLTSPAGKTLSWDQLTGRLPLSGPLRKAVVSLWMSVDNALQHGFRLVVVHSGTLDEDSVCRWPFVDIFRCPRASNKNPVLVFNSHDANSGEDAAKNDAYSARFTAVEAFFNLWTRARFPDLRFVLHPDADSHCVSDPFAFLAQLPESTELAVAVQFFWGLDDYMDAEFWPTVNNWTKRETLEAVDRDLYNTARNMIGWNRHYLRRCLEQELLPPVLETRPQKLWFAPGSDEKVQVRDREPAVPRLKDLYFEAFIGSSRRLLSPYFVGRADAVRRANKLVLDAYLPALSKASARSTQNFREIEKEIADLPPVIASKVRSLSSPNGTATICDMSLHSAALLLFGYTPDSPKAVFYTNWADPTQPTSFPCLHLQWHDVPAETCYNKLDLELLGQMGKSARNGEAKLPRNRKLLPSLRYAVKKYNESSYWSRRLRNEVGLYHSGCSQDKPCPWLANPLPHSIPLDITSKMREAQRGDGGFIYMTCSDEDEKEDRYASWFWSNNAGPGFDAARVGEGDGGGQGWNARRTYG